MLSQVTPVRYLPRTPQELAALRREASLRAAVSDLADCVTKIEKEQRIQLQRIAQIQAELDEIKQLLKRSKKR